MRLPAGILLLAFAGQASERVAPEPKHFRFERSIAPVANDSSVKPGERLCAVLDAILYAHAKPGLADVRLFAGATEVPYAGTLSETPAASERAEVLNLGQSADRTEGQSSGHIVFDLQMPARPYSKVNLAFSGENFLATAKVTGLASLAQRSAEDGTLLGTFTLFDLSGQRLGRSTSLLLAESQFPFLHLDLTASAAPGHAGFLASPQMVTGATVPPSREAQTLYTTVARTTSLANVDRESVASFDVPAHVPVERISFELDPQDATNFSRTVQVTAQAVALGKAAPREPPSSEDVFGTISRIRITEGGKEIRRESLDVDATLGSNGQAPARVRVSIKNGDDRPLAIRAVRLEMRERRLCFDAPAAPVTLYYGDDQLLAPVYDYSQLFQPSDASLPAHLQPEQTNPRYAPRSEPTQTLTERYPQILWVALLAVVAVLGAVALRAARGV